MKIVHSALFGQVTQTIQLENWKNFGIRREAFTIWLGIFCLGNMHVLCHFLSVSMVTWSQNEPSEGQKKYPVDKYTKESNVMDLNFKFAQSTTIKNLYFLKRG